MSTTTSTPSRPTSPTIPPPCITCPSAHPLLVFHCPTCRTYTPPTNLTTSPGSLSKQPSPICILCSTTLSPDICDVFIYWPERRCWACGLHTRDTGNVRRPMNPHSTARQRDRFECQSCGYILDGSSELKWVELTLSTNEKLRGRGEGEGRDGKRKKDLWDGDIDAKILEWRRNNARVREEWTGIRACVRVDSMEK